MRRTKFMYSATGLAIHKNLDAANSYILIRFGKWSSTITTIAAYPAKRILKQTGASQSQIDKITF